MHKCLANLKSDQFAAQRSLERIDIRHNLITTIDGGAFQGLVQPKEILLSGNRLTTFNSDVFSVSFEGRFLIHIFLSIIFLFIGCRIID